VKSKLFGGTAALLLVDAPPDPGPVSKATASPRITATVPLVVENTGLSRSVIFRLLAAGQLQAVKAGSRTLILWDTVVNYVASLPVAKFGGRV
jgi:predicted DNA-binding transcriptional regulator AlpA